MRVRVQPEHIDAQDTGAATVQETHAASAEIRNIKHFLLELGQVCLLDWSFRAAQLLFVQVVDVLVLLLAHKRRLQELESLKGISVGVTYIKNDSLKLE